MGEETAREAVMYIGVIKLPAGKAAAQAAHAAVECYRRSGIERHHWKARKAWVDTQAKVVVKATHTDFEQLKHYCKKRGITFVEIRDAGRTVVAPGTLTAFAAGPMWKDESQPFAMMKLY